MADIRITPAVSVMAFTSSLGFKETFIQGASGSIVLAGSGSTGRTNLFAVDGNNGRLFSIDDDLSNSLFSVNTIAGLPVIEAFADNTVNIGKYGAYSFQALGNGNAGIGSGSVMFVSASGNVIVGSTTSDLIGLVGCKFIAIGNSGFQYSPSAGTFLAIIPGAANGEVAIKADARSGAYPPMSFYTSDVARMTIADNGNVGIGTTAPTALSGYKTLTLDATSGTFTEYRQAGTAIFRVGVDSSRPFFNGMTNANMDFYTNGALRMTITAGGNVGIGVTNPYEILDVNGNIRLGNYPTAGTRYIGYGNNTFATQFIAGMSIESTTLGGNYSQKLNFVTHRYNVSADIRMTISEVGNVGIGTTNPSTKLSLEGAADLLRLTHDNAYISFYNTANTTRTGYIQYNTGADVAIMGENATSLSLGVGSTTRLFINSSGNVGIGTTTPTTKLQVNGGVHVTGTDTPASGAGIELRYVGSVSYIGSYDRSSSVYRNLFFYSNDTIFENGSIERMRITSAGLVGIGTTNPTYRLEVRNNAAATAALFYSTTTSTQVTIGGTDNSSLSNIVWYNDSGNAQIFRGGSTFASWAGALSLNIYNSNGVIAFHPGATANVLYLNTSGLVGIGTSNTIATLTVRTAANSVVGISDNTGIPKIGGYLDNGTLDDLQIDSTILYVSNNNSTTMAVSGSKVLIGLTSTVLSNKLVVQGDIWCTGITGSIITPGSNKQVLYNNAGTWDGASGLVYSSGNVGIGTTNPGRLLNISGNGTDGTQVQINGTSDSAGIKFIPLSGDNWEIQANTSNQWFIYNRTDGAYRFTIDGSGNVGIGVTNPSGKLQIYGADTVVNLTNTNAGGYGEFWFTEGTTLKAEMFVVGSSLSTYAGANSFIIYQNSNAPIAFYTNGTNERMRITGAGNVGIGTTNPATKLDVVGTNIRTDKAFISQGGNATWSGAACFMDYNVSPAYGRIGVYDYSEPNWQNLYVGGGGKVGIGTTTFTYKLNLLGDMYITGGSIGVGVAPNATDGRIDASNDIVAYSTSDIRFKENIQRIPNALEKVNTLSGNTFTWKSDPELTILHGFEGNDVGIIAQEIEAILPDIVTTRDSGYKAVKYEKLVPLLIEAIKELTDKVNKLENR
jgi:hypothetical protein